MTLPSNLMRGQAAARQRANEILKRVSHIDKPRVIEVGVNHGNLSKQLLALNPNLRLVMVDSWEGEEHQPEAYKNTKDRNAFRSQAEATAAFSRASGVQQSFNDRCTILRSDSVSAALSLPDLYADLIFIDADHSYEGCLADIQAYLRVTREWIGGHDYKNPQPQFNFSGVDRAVEETFGEVEEGKNVTWFKKVV